MSPDLILGIDSSTTACKAIAWDAQGSAVAEGRCPIATATPQPGWHEQNATDWWEALCAAVQEVTQQIDPSRLAGLAIAHQRETFVPVNAHDKPLCPAILWMDERAALLLPEIGDLLGRARFHRVTGKPLSVNLMLPKIAWLRRFRPEAFDSTVYYLDVHAFLVQRLTGEYATGWGCACPGGLFDLKRHTWAEELYAPIGVRPEQLPRAYAPGTILGNVTPEAARATGLPAGLPVAAGLGDGQAAALGANTTTTGEACLTLGTSVISGTFSERFVTGRAFRTMIGSQAYLLETALLSGGYTLSWLRRFLGLDENTSQENLDAQASAIPLGSDGLVLVPYWNSVLGPYWDASASGIVVGWRGIHRPAHLYRAVLEGIAFEQRLNTEGVEAALGSNIERYIAVGGGAKNALWLQIIADITGKQVWRAATHEAAALGAGILAAVGAGLYPTLRQAAAAMSHYQPDAFIPDPTRHDAYSKLYTTVYRTLFPALQPALRALADLAQPASAKGAVT
ncbi:MAG: xylulokinase [Chloroflexota bacterium]